MLDMSGSKQLVMVEYPTQQGVRAGYISNVITVIRYDKQDKWKNGSTTEIVYEEAGGKLGSLDPQESATPLYRKGSRLHVVYKVSNGTKSGYVEYGGGYNG